MSDFKSDDSWAVIGLASTALLHELGNHLNRIGLQAFLVQRKADAALKPDLQIIRDDCKHAAQLMQPIHDQRQSRQSNAVAVDIAALLQLSPSVKITADPQTVRILFSLLQRVIISPEMPPLLSADAESLRIRYAVPMPKSVGVDQMFEEQGPFERLNTLERWAVQRALRETAANCAIVQDGDQAFLQVEWKTS